MLQQQHKKKTTTLLTSTFLIILLTTTFLTYQEMLTFDFLNYDDPELLESNPLIQQGWSWSSFKSIWTHSSINLWTPLATLSHGIETWLYSEASARKFHLTDLALHLLCTLLLFDLLRTYFRDLWVALFVTCCFALHPVQAESICWISDRKGGLAALFTLLSLRFALIRQHPVTQSRWFPAFGYTASITCAALAGMSKPSTVVLPALILLTLVYRAPSKTHHRSHHRLPILGKTPLLEWALTIHAAAIRRWLVFLAPYLMIAAVTAVLAIHFQTQGEHWQYQMPLGKRLIYVPLRVGFYLEQLFTLQGYTLYPAAVIKPGSASFWRLTLIGSLLIATLGWSIIARKNSNLTRIFQWGSLWLLVCLAPGLGIVKAGNFIGCDRYLYVAMIGPMVTTAFLFHHGIMSLLSTLINHGNSQTYQYTGATLLLALVSTFCFLTCQQVGTWRNDNTLYQQALRVNPNNGYVLTRLGIEAMTNHQDIHLALIHLTKAKTCEDATHETWAYLGKALYMSGQHSKAVLSWEHSITMLQHDNEIATGSLGQWLVYQRNSSKADLERGLTLLELAIKNNPDPVYIKAAIHASRKLGREDLILLYTKMLPATE